jgi:hypothetical protein
MVINYVKKIDGTRHESGMVAGREAGPEGGARYSTCCGVLPWASSLSSESVALGGGRTYGDVTARVAAGSSANKAESARSAADAVIRVAMGIGGRWLLSESKQEAYASGEMRTAVSGGWLLGSHGYYRMWTCLWPDSWMYTSLKQLIHELGIHGIYSRTSCWIYTGI